MSVNEEQQAARIAALEADKKRMDWIEKDLGEVSWRVKSWAIIAGRLQLTPLYPHPKGRPFPTFETAREAIDHALKELEGKPDA
jgi:hypothetical protein